MKNLDWFKETRMYDLSDGYSIVRADWNDFSVYFAIYEVLNLGVEAQNN